MMENVFKMMSESGKQTNAKAEKGKLLNSEMDDITMPDDTDLPPVEDLLKLTTALDKKVDQTDSTPIAVRQSSFITDVGSAPDSPVVGEAIRDSEFLSVTSEVNEHTESIAKISATVRQHEGKLGSMVQLDSEVRKLTAEMNELKTDIKDMKHTLKEIRQSASAYQTATARKIADVERRAATHQLEANPTPDEKALAPPDEVTATRTDITQQTGTSVKEKRITAINLGDF